MGMKKPVRVGFDFDGVIAYNPARLVRAPISLFKRNVLGIKKLSFFYPKTAVEKLMWKLVHNSSVFPGNGIELFKKTVSDNKIEAHLITARYGYLDTHLNNWLKKYGIEKYFTSIHINRENKQPHLFKEETISKLKLNYFVEDNWDIVEYLSQRTNNKEQAIEKKKKSVKIFWIYNIIDTWLTPYEHKFPNVGKAVERIINENK